MARTSADEGLSLIELVVVVLLLTILGSAAVLIFANSWRTQNDVTSTTQATNQGQVFGQAIERAVRNAACADVVDERTLRVRTVYPVGDSRRYQQFWIADSSEDPKISELFYSKSASTAMPATAPWADSVEHISNSETYFSLSPDGKTVYYAIDVTTDAAPVTISGSVSLRNTSGGSTPCWS